MPGPCVIALLGPKRSGKDTIARLVVALSTHEVVRLALADPFKDAFDRLSGPSRDLHKELDAAGWPLRQAHQQLGTESREAVGVPLLWVHTLLAQVHYLHRLHPAPRHQFVVPDLRYPHEASALRVQLKAWGGCLHLWRVERPGLEDDGDAHNSERSHRAIAHDELIVNDSTRGALAGPVGRLVAALEA